VFLFGEHAVVYGKPGIAMAIRPRVYVTVRKSKVMHHARSPYIDGCFEEMGVKGSVYVNSQIPSSSGLGSSAAVTVATVSAINDEFSLGFSQEEVANSAFLIEKRVQGGKASPTDTSVATFGGLILILGTQRRRLPPQNFNMVIGNTMVSHSTGKMVEMVAELRKRQPDICNPVMDAIEGVTMGALRYLQDQSQLGRYMNMNHALLDVLGVGHPSLTRLVLAARSAGALGAKTTGAGGGGCMIAICPRTVKNRVAKAIETAEGRAIITTMDPEGVRKERDVT
jgi:mevalonate kinase